MSDTPPPSFYGSSPDPEQAPGQQPPRAQSPFGLHDTQAMPPQGNAPAGPAGRRPGGRTGLVAGVLTGALVVGGLAGLGGAAIHEEWIADDSSSSSSASSEVAPPVIDKDTPQAGRGSVEGVADQVLPSVVRIDVSGANGAGSGSGIVLTEDGQILTNEHVISGVSSGGTISVAFDDGTRAEAEVLGADPLTDTAVIQAKDVSGLTPATIGNSADLRVGQQVVAIGSPFGLDATVTSGIVSALGRPVNVSSDGQGNSTTYPAIQTDAAINPGNSGGPLVDLSGRVVGINSSIRTATSNVSGQGGSIGLGFAIPIDEIMPVVEQMADGETPTHARMGVQVSDASASSDSSSLGALVGDVTSGSSADKAGLESGDVITKVDDEVIDSADDLVATVRTYRPDDEVKVTVMRDGEERTVDLVLDSDAD
ncbi:S1C family serine protease [Nocardioides campestrisoli]|uniref:S1C family serine protease n=1 Tax=Nocardioides campestrisoli TaxID=2736757 RepID=UPI001CD51B27|nr:trypsin-like peptidase domain-containing protein [Nocardioides campestrisoli]